MVAPASCRPRGSGGQACARPPSGRPEPSGHRAAQRSRKSSGFDVPLSVMTTTGSEDLLPGRSGIVTVQVVWSGQRDGCRPAAHAGADAAGRTEEAGAAHLHRLTGRPGRGVQFRQDGRDRRVGSRGTGGTGGRGAGGGSRRRRWWGRGSRRRVGGRHGRRRKCGPHRRMLTGRRHRWRAVVGEDRSDEGGHDDGDSRRHDGDGAPQPPLGVLDPPLSSAGAPRPVRPSPATPARSSARASKTSTGRDVGRARRHRRAHRRVVQPRHIDHRGIEAWRGIGPCRGSRAFRRNGRVGDGGGSGWCMPVAAAPVPPSGARARRAASAMAPQGARAGVRSCSVSGPAWGHEPPPTSVTPCPTHCR